MCSGLAVSVGGPAFTYWISPSEDELRKRYNPDLQKRSIEGREERQQEFNDFVSRLKEYSKSDKPGTCFVYLLLTLPRLFREEGEEERN